MTPDSHYWLSRGPGAAAEGPFMLAQLRSMFQAGQLTAEAQVCREHHQTWQRLAELVSFNTAPDLHAALSSRDDETAAKCQSAITWLTFMVCLVAMVPLAGAVAGLLIWGPYALICTVLAIIMLTKGRTGNGIASLIGVWLVTPLVMMLMQMVGLALASVMTVAPAALSSPEAAHKRPPDFEARDVMSRSGWATTGVDFKTVTLAGKTVVKATFPKEAGRDVWTFDFDANGAVARITTVAKGQIYPKMTEEKNIPDEWRDEALRFIGRKQDATLLQVDETGQGADARLHVRFLDKLDRPHEWRFQFKPGGKIAEVYSHTTGIIPLE